MYRSSTYLELANRLNDWLRVSNAGANVGNRALDLLNRAQEDLTMHRAWNDMLYDVALDVTDYIAALPSDMARIVEVFYDTDSDGKKEGGWYHRGPRNKGFKIITSGDKDLGYTYKIRFYQTLGQSPILRYQKKLDDFEDFEDHSENVQYSFFPGELLIRAAQNIHIIETGLTGAEMAVIQRDYDKQIQKYEKAHDWYTVQLRRKPVDIYGRETYIENINLSGNYSYGENNNDGLSRSHDRSW